MRHLIFGNDNSRRVNHWRIALGDATVQLVTYQQVAKGNFPVVNEPTTIRITSPSEDFETYKLLLSLGGYPQAEQLEFEKGRIYLHQYWYKGWCRMLDKIQRFLNEHPLAYVMNHPNPIKLTFNKIKCQQLLAENGIPIPNIYTDKLRSFKQLLELLETNQVPQVFLKPAHGSSASGIMMFRKSGKRMLLETTIRAKQKGGEMKLFNYLRLQKYNDPATIQAIIEQMVPNRLHVEEWILKKRFRAKSTDFRVLTIHQEPVFVQPRHSHHPITNLHLGNEKGSLVRLEEEWGRPAINKVKTVAQKTARRFPNLFYAGIDIAIDAEDNPYVLEVNPFGDFLQEIFVEGKNTFELELQYWHQKLTLENEPKTNQA